MKDGIPIAEDFERILECIFDCATQQGRSHVDVRAGDIHRLAGHYPGPDHRMPVCCEVLRRKMGAGDEIIQAPPKGDGATVRIRYRIPR